MPVLALPVLFTLTACTPGGYDFSACDREISRDLGVLPQNLAVYAGTGDNPLPPDGVKPDTPLLSRKRQQFSVERALKLFYAPWRKSKAEFKQKEAMWAMYALKPERGFIENLRPYPLERWAALVRNSAAESFPNSAVKAITLRRADLRLMPTHSPYYFDPARPGQGYPFDYYQNSSLPAATPVFISHVSADGAWAMVETASAGGWVDLRDLARVDDAFIRDWMRLPLAAITAENLVVRPVLSGEASSSGNASKVTRATGVTGANGTANLSDLPPQVETVSIGTLLPLSRIQQGGGKAAVPDGDYDDWRNLEKLRQQAETAETFIALFPVRGNDGQARIGTVRLNAAVQFDDASAPVEQAALWPLPVDRRHIAELGSLMLSQPYGWGGYGGNRDCSSTMRDLFLSFGLWLPRNSGAQAKIGQRTDLSGMTPRQKEEMIMRQGKPFITMISMPGHIGLYLGPYSTASGDRALMFHNVWGLRTESGATVFQPAREGRAVIGKAVVTTLTPGEERGDLSTPNSLLDRVTGMNIIAVE